MSVPVWDGDANGLGTCTVAAGSTDFSTGTATGTITFESEINITEVSVVMQVRTANANPAEIHDTSIGQLKVLKEGQNEGS